MKLLFALLLVSGIFCSASFAIDASEDIPSMLIRLKLDANKVREMLLDKALVEKVKAWADGSNVDDKTIRERLMLHQIDVERFRQFVRDQAKMAKLLAWANSKAVEDSHGSDDDFYRDIIMKKHNIDMDKVKQIIAIKNLPELLTTWFENRQKSIVDSDKTIGDLIAKYNINVDLLVEGIKNHNLIPRLREFITTLKTKSGFADDKEAAFDIDAFVKKNQIDAQELKKAILSDDFPEILRNWISDLRAKRTPINPKFKIYVAKFKIDEATIKALVASKRNVIEDFINWAKNH